MAKADTAVARYPLTLSIRPSCRHVIAGARELPAIDRVCRVMVGKDAIDAAHFTEFYRYI